MLSKHFSSLALIIILAFPVSSHALPDLLAAAASYGDTIFYTSIDNRLMFAYPANPVYMVEWSNGDVVIMFVYFQYDSLNYGNFTRRQKTGVYIIPKTDLDSMAPSTSLRQFLHKEDNPPFTWWLDPNTVYSDTPYTTYAWSTFYGTRAKWVYEDLGDGTTNIHFIDYSTGENVILFDAPQIGVPSDFCYYIHYSSLSDYTNLPLYSVDISECQSILFDVLPPGLNTCAKLTQGNCPTSREHIVYWSNGVPTEHPANPAPPNPSPWTDQRNIDEAKAYLTSHTSTIYPYGPQSTLNWGFDQPRTKVFANTSSFNPRKSSFAPLSTVSALFINKNKDIESVVKSKINMSVSASGTSLFEFDSFGRHQQFDFSKLVPLLTFLKFVFTSLSFAVVLKMLVKRKRQL